MTGIRLYSKPAPWEAWTIIIIFPVLLALLLWYGRGSEIYGLLILGALAVTSLFWPKVYRNKFLNHPDVLKEHPRLPQLYRIAFIIPMITFLVGVVIYITIVRGGP